MMGWLSEARTIYRASLKQRDSLFNRWLARPLAASLLVPLRRTRMSPNQLTIIGALVFALGAVLLTFLPGPEGFLLAVLVLELAYVLDQADGQLARLTGRSSRLGAYLDYLVDELKAQLLVLAASVRLFLFWGEALSLLVGIFALAAVAAATSMTTLIRRAEFAGQEQLPGLEQGSGARPRRLIGWPTYLLKATLRFVLHYPSWLWLVALLAFTLDLDGAELFLWPYAVVAIAAAGFNTLRILRRAWTS
jgi:phosphatidylglycerophosphate synthase